MLRLGEMDPDSPGNGSTHWLGKIKHTKAMPSMTCATEKRSYRRMATNASTAAKRTIQLWLDPTTALGATRLRTALT